MDAQEEPGNAAAFSAAPVGQPLRISVHSQARLRVITLAGAVQLDQAAELRNRLVAAVEPHAPDLIIDLSELAFMGSTGLSALLAARSEALRHGGRVHLVAPRPAIAGLLRVVRLDRLFPIHDRLTDALKALGQTAE